jgi:hypothetical protein
VVQGDAAITKHTDGSQIFAKHIEIEGEFTILAASYHVGLGIAPPFMRFSTFCNSTLADWTAIRLPVLYLPISFLDYFSHFKTNFETKC